MEQLSCFYNKYTSKFFKLSASYPFYITVHLMDIQFVLHIFYTDPISHDLQINLSGWKMNLNINV